MQWIKQFKRLPYFFQFLYQKIISSIAFLPSLIIIGFFFLTGVMIYWEQHGLTSNWQDQLPSFLLIKSGDVAHSILTTLVGALISLMVFSFSMVMVLLNNAASNYSPRILPSLISNKFHQIVLGTYLGTITYCLIFAMNINPESEDASLPGISILFGIFLGLHCLMLFVFFIHSISESVQVGKILKSLQLVTLHNLKSTVENQQAAPLSPNIDSWQRYESDRSGYLRSIQKETLVKICQNEDLKIKVLLPESEFILEGTDLFACNRQIETALQHKILGTFIFSIDKLVEEDPIVGFRQITEIAVKAMSPGINDPGTALLSIDYLTILFAEKMKLIDHGAFVLPTEEGNIPPVVLWTTPVKFAEVLNGVLASLRQYSKHDLLVVLKMFRLLKFLNAKRKDFPHHQAAIDHEILTLREDAAQALTNPKDFQQVETYLKTFTSS